MTQRDPLHVLISGATNGIGEAAAIALAKDGGSLTLIARNAEKAEAVCDRLRRAGAASAEVIVADLSRPSEARVAGEAFAASHERLDVLINNAGAVFLKREETPDGFERTFALNHLGYASLTAALMPLIRDQKARIVSTASHAHYMIDDMYWDDLQMVAKWPRRGWDAYCQSKLANIMWTYALARRLGRDHAVNAVHPGFVRTGLGANNGFLGKLLVPIIGRFGARTPEKGAATIIWAARSPEMADITGKYLYDRQITRSSKASNDVDKQERLWALTESLCSSVGG